MDTATITGIVVAAVGTLFVGMAGLIQKMVVSKLDNLQNAFDDMRNDHHRLDVRVTKLEAEHSVMYCKYRGDE